MTTLQSELRKQRYMRSVEDTTIKVGMAAPILFSAWVTYHFVKIVVLGFLQLLP